MIAHLKHFKKGFTGLLVILAFTEIVYSQIPRKRVSTAAEPVLIFKTTNLGAQSTVENLPARNLNVTIMHIFGVATDKPLNNFFGLDFGPNVRLGIDYGITDNWSVGIGRSSRRKIVDARSKFVLLRQKEKGAPVGLSIKGDLGITTEENGFEFIDRLNYLLSVPIARKFTDKLSLQVNPMYAHFNLVYDQSDPNDFIALGIGGQYIFSRRYALFFESYPMISKMAPGTQNAVLVGLDIDTGGHVFQLFLASAPWQIEQYVLYRNTDDFWAGDLRFGFNVNRIFGIAH